MAIQSETQAQSVNVVWRQQTQSYTIELSGPLGQGRALIQGSKSGVQMLTGNQTHSSTNLNQLTKEITGLDLPLESLFYWLHSRADPSTDATIQYHQNKQVKRIIQAGWTIDYLAYFEEPNLKVKKMQFSKEQQTGKLVIRRWL